jgi:hypothetical protein
MNYLELDEVLAEAMSITRDANRYENVGKQWAYTALMQLGSSDDELDVCELTPKNLVCKKPNNCRKVEDIELYDFSGNSIPFVFRAGKKRINSSSSEGVDVSEDRTHIILGSNGDCVSAVKIRFWSYPLDDKGQPMIREDEKLAIIFYIRFMIALEKDDNMSKIQMDEFRWKMEADRVRAAKKAGDFSKAKIRAMKRDWLRLLPVFNTKRF